MEIPVTQVDLLDASSTTGLLDATVESLARPCPLRRHGRLRRERPARCMPAIAGVHLQSRDA